MDTKRIEYMDALRGLAVFLMVMGHVLAWIFTDYKKAMDTNLYSGLLWKFIYAFHMPLFMFVSGYFFKMNLNNNWLKESCKLIYKKFVALLIPFAVAGYLLWVVRNNGVEYWFLRTLFLLFVLCLPLYLLSNVVISKLKQANKYRCLLIDLLIFCIGYIFLKMSIRVLNTELQIIFNYGVAIVYYPYFVLGLLLRKHELIQRILSKNIIYTLALFTFTALFLFNMFGYLTTSAGIIAVDVITLSAIIFLYYFVQKCANNSNKIFKCFSYMGIHSIEIYLIHFFFAFRLTELGEYLINVNFYGTSLLIQILYSVTISVIITALSLGVAKIINCSKILSFFLFGKMHNFSEIFGAK